MAKQTYILELNFERTWRGGERQTLYNMRGFREAGINVVLLCRKGFPLEAKAKTEGFDVFAFSNIFQVIAFFIFRCRRYTVFHAQTSHILTYCLLTRPIHRAKIIFTRRVDFVPRGWLTKTKYQLTDQLVAISTAVKDIIEQFSARKAVVISDVAIPKALQASHAASIIQRLDIPAGKRIIGTTAALVPHKDPLTMVAAIHQLSIRRSDFVFLHFGDGDLMPAVQQRIAELGLQDVYKLVGFVQDVEDMFTRFEVFTMSSEEEGLGSSVLDAFLYNVPVVGTNAGGLADLLRDGRGIMCAKKAPDELANGIDLLLNDAGLCKEITAKAHSYVVQYHSLPYITQQYLQLL